MWGNEDGQVFALIVMVVAACEVTVGLGLIVAIYRRQLPIDVDELHELQRMSADHLRLAGAAVPAASGTILIGLGYARWPGLGRLDRDAGDRAGVRCAVGALISLLGQPDAPRADLDRCGTTTSSVGVDAKLQILVDPLSVFMILVVSGVSTLIHLYSIGYMTLRPRLRAVLLVPELLRVLDAAAGAGRQLPAADRRLGVRRRRLLPADLVLVPAHDRDQRRASRRS